MIRFYCFLFLLAITNSVYPQGIKYDNFRYLTINDGLSQSTVLSIAQDSAGFIWLGTIHGLNRYDGHNVRSYFYDNGDTTSISGNTINVLFLSSQNQLWAGAEQGVSKYISAGNIFENFAIHNENGLPQKVFDIKEFNPGILYLATSDGIFCLDVSSGRYYRPEEKLPSGLKVNALYQDTRGRLWAGSEKGLILAEKGESGYKMIRVKTSGPQANDFQTIMEDADGNIWAGSFYGLYIFDDSGKLKKKYLHQPGNDYSLNHNSVRQVFTDPEGRIIVATWKGLNIYYPEKDGFIITGSPGEPGGMNDEVVNVYFRDRSGAMWFGTSFGGANFIFPDYRNFNNILYEPGKKNSLTGGVVTAITKLKDSRLLIGTVENSLYSYDKEKGQVSAFPENSKLLSPHIRSLFNDGRGAVWIGYWTGGLTRYDINNRSMKHYARYPDNNGEIGSVTSLTSDKKGNIYAGLAGEGILKITAENRIRQFYPDETDENKNENFINAVAFSGGSIFCGSKAGLFSFDINSEKFTKTGGLLPDGKEPEISCLYKGRGGKIYAGAKGSGLFIYDPATETSRNISLKEVIPDNLVNAVVYDGKYIWASANRGLCRINPGTEEITVFDETEGVQGNEFNRNSYYAGKDGKIYFGGLNGITWFDPETVKFNKFKPPVVITSIKIFDKLINYRESPIISITPWTADNIILNYDQKMVTFEFSALSYIFPEKNRYAYKLLGFDEDWQNAGNFNYAVFTNLDPGEYELLYKAANNDGVWNEDPSQLKITVLPPFWKTTWFRILILLAAIGIIYAIYKARINYLLGHEKLRIKIATDLHDEVGSSLTKISMSAGLGMYSNSLEDVKNKLTGISENSREVASAMGDIVWSIDARKDYIDDLVNRMKDAAFNLLSDTGMEYEFHVKGLDPQKKLPVEKRQNIYLIFKEALNNAAKYSEASKINVYLSNKPEMFEMIIRDNGTGLKKRKGTGGNGIRNMKLRAEKIDGKLDIINNGGVTVRLETMSL